ncbi:hypothetical protein BC938DRAFT_478464 [Jimgerdemannia flammicorona]|uniref:Uncharacterized protein n=1 Tax=Jimgerdemannia flammicorona TaxID=994334 RepID=A0A433QYD8_9FUNG|nr:hypothetical protein BC938DRAFT_478464 [Jimgerdemannia flammicorona]
MSNHSQNNSLNNSPSLLGKSAVKPPAICQNGDLNGNLDDLNDIPSRRLEEPTAKPPATWMRSVSLTSRALQVINDADEVHYSLIMKGIVEIGAVDPEILYMVTPVFSNGNWEYKAFDQRSYHTYNYVGGTCTYIFRTVS